MRLLTPSKSDSLLSPTFSILSLLLLLTLPSAFSLQDQNPNPLVPVIRNSIEDLCPSALKSIPNVCERFKCVNNITRESCPPETFYMEKLTLCGCCPGCAEYIGLPEPTPKRNPLQCTLSPAKTTRSVKPDCLGPSCPVLINQCMPGLICDEATGLCSLPSLEYRPPCSQKCMYQKSLKRLGLFHWDPDCESDGSFAPKQCKGDHVTGICFCVDKCGERIFGREFRVDAKNQTCACSRQVKELRDSGLISTLHCTSSGDYEPLQCDTDSGVCYCVDEKTGRLNGAVMPQSSWTKLPCLTPNVTNFMKDGKYLRKCESQFAAIQSIIQEGHEHNEDYSLREFKCDYDGSYAPRQDSGTRRDCVYKNGTTIKDYFDSNQKQKDCNCARDQFLYQTTGRPFSFVCELQLGNYPNSFDFGSYASCVDRDGIPYGDMVPSKHHCCLEGTCPFIKIGECYNAVTNPTGYRSCCSWPLTGGTCK